MVVGGGRGDGLKAAKAGKLVATKWNSNSTFVSLKPLDIFDERQQCLNASVTLSLQWQTIKAFLMESAAVATKTGDNLENKDSFVRTQFKIIWIIYLKMNWTFKKCEIVT